MKKDESTCGGCGSSEKAPGAEYCPICEQVLIDQHNEAEREWQRQMDYERWVEENGPYGHGHG